MPLSKFKGGRLHDGFDGSGDSVESMLPSFCRSCKIQDKEAAVTALTVMAVLAVMAILVVTASPLKLNPLCRHPEKEPLRAQRLK